MTRGWRVLLFVAAGLPAALGVFAQRPPSAPLPTVPIVRLAVPDRMNAVPALAARGAFVAVVWAATAENQTDAFVAVSRDGGRSFGGPSRVNDVPGTVRAATESGPRVALGPLLAGRTDPVVTVVWAGREPASTIRLTRSRDGGRTFDASTRLEGEHAVGNRGWASLDVDDRGAARVVWLDHRRTAAWPGGEHHHGGGVTSAPVRDTEPTPTDAVARAQLSGLYMASGSGPAREIARGVCYCCKTSMASGPGGVVVASWRHVFDGNLRDIAFVLSRDGGRTFGAPTRVSQDGWAIDGCPEDGPAVALDTTGAVHLAWPTVVPGPAPFKAVFYASARDGVHASPRMQLSPRGRTVAHPSIVLAADGLPLVAWDGAGTDRAIWMTAGMKNGRFGPPTRLSGEVDASYPVGARTSDGVLWAWREQEGAATRIAVSRPPR